MSETLVKRILLIEDEPADIEVARRFLALAGGGTLALTAVNTLADGIAALAQAAFDLVLLDQHLPDSSGEETFTEVQTAAPHVPIVLLTGLGDESEGAKRVRQGAQDYLVKGRFDAATFVRVIHYALERWRLLQENARLRLQEEHDRQLRALIDVAQASPESKKQPLRDSAPEVWSKMVSLYGAFLDRALDRRIYRVEADRLAGDLTAFSSELVAISAGPREVVEIHSAAMNAKMHEDGDGRSQAYLGEGRLLLLETMGSLVKAYRHLAARKA